MRTLFRWLLVLAWAAFIFYMSSRSALELNSGLLGQIKDQLNLLIAGFVGYESDFMSVVAHFCEYLVLGVLLANALRSFVGIGFAAALGLCLASAYGVTDEYHQLYVAGRFCSPADWGTDTAGAALGALLSLAFFRKR